MSDPTAAADAYFAVEIDLFVGGSHNLVADFFTFRGDKISRLVIYGLAPR